MSSSEVIIQDTGWNELQDSIEDLMSMDVEIGYTQKGGGDGIGLADLAIIHEFGTKIEVTAKMRGYLGSQGMHLKKSTTHITIPPRPFMRDSFDNNVDEIGDTGVNLMVKVLEGTIDADMSYEIWGDSFKSIIQNGVLSRTLGLTANSDFTIERKGSETPLADSGRLINGSQVIVSKR